MLTNPHKNTERGAVDRGTAATDGRIIPFAARSAEQKGRAVTAMTALWDRQPYDEEMEQATMGESERIQWAEAVRTACVRAAMRSYEDARMDGLCDEGAFEVAIDAVRSLDLTVLARRESQTGGR